MKINGYQLDEQIKETEFVTVYRATQVALDRPALLKVIKSQFASETNVMERLRREALAVAKISHPNVIHVYDFGEENGTVYVAMEYFPSKDFQRVLQERKQLVLELCISALKQSLKGLSAAHKQGIFHRDIKPANLLLGENDLVKITDFGLANLTGATGVTIEGSIIGTPRYMSPEQISGAKPSPQSEIFSLGVTFYEILTGISPFDAESYSAVFNKILNHESPAVQDLRSQIPERLSEIVQRMIAKDPDARFPDCDAVLTELDQISDKVQTPEQPVDSFQNLQPTPPQKRRSIGYIFALLMLAIIGGIIIYNLYYRPPEMTNLTQPESPQEVVSPIDTIADTTRSQDENTMLVQHKDSAEIHPGETPPGRTTAEKQEPISQDTVNEKNTASVEVTPAKLWVGVLPWAEVRVDGDSVGTTPLQNPMELPPGEHLIELTHPGYPAITKTVHLTSGSSDSLRVDFAKQSGYISLAVYPWAALYIDGKFVDNTPIPKPVILAPGRHLLQLKHPEYKNWQTYVDVEAGDTVSLKVTL